MSPDLERLIRLQQLDMDAEARRRTLVDLPAALQALDDRISARQGHSTQPKPGSPKIKPPAAPSTKTSPSSKAD